MRWALEAVVVDHLTVSRAAAGLGVGWHTANTAVLAEGKRVLIDDPARFDGVRVIGVDEHVWRHTRLGEKFVTVVIDLTPIREKTGPSRLLDMVEGRSKQVFKTWLAGRPIRSTSFASPATPWMSAVAASSSPCTTGGAGRTTRSTRPAAHSTPAPGSSPTGSKPTSRHYSLSPSTSRSRQPGASTSA
jgi:hypothetical protein